MTLVLTALYGASLLGLMLLTLLLLVYVWPFALPALALDALYALALGELRGWRFRWRFAHYIVGVLTGATGLLGIVGFAKSFLGGHDTVSELKNPYAVLAVCVFLLVQGALALRHARAQS